MQQNKYISILILTLILAGSRVNGQINKINADTINIRNFKEEVYLQTDRDVYITGETIWMKLYMLNRLNSSLSNESKVIYLELLDNSGNIIKQLKVSIDGYSGEASMRLADTLKTDNYLIRAYSNWMQNYSEDLFFYKYISVINPFKNVDRLINKNINQLPDSVKFFPEGGNLIPGIMNRICVRSTGIDGEPVKMEGVIVNNNGAVICPVKTDTLGFGIISLKPSKTEPLFVQFKSRNSVIRNEPLPGIIEGSVTLSAESDVKSSSFKLLIHRYGNFIPEGKKSQVVIITGGLVAWMRDVNIEHDSVINVPFKSIPDGSSLVILTDGYGNKLSERWIYNSSNRKLNLSISFPKQDYTSRQKISIGISASDEAGMPVSANLSVSVVKTCLIEKGRIDILNKDEYSAAPGNWFSGLTAEEMNDRLLYRVNGMNIYNDLLNQSKGLPSHLPELGGQLVNGVLRSRSDHEPLKETDISLAFISKTAKCQFLKTDANGEFNFVVSKPGLNEIVIQPLKPVASGYFVEFNQPFCTTFSYGVPPVFNLDSTKTDLINEAIISMQVNNIYEPFRKQNDKIADKTLDHAFYGMPDKKINLADFIELTSVKEVIKEIVPDLLITKRNKENVFRLVNLPTSSSDNPPLVLVDGVPVNSITKLLEVSAKEIERIDILNSRYYFTDYVFEGIVSFVTKKGNLSSMEYDNSVFRQVFEGCQLPRKFYSPDYSVKSEATYRIPDFRNTLYWKPDLMSDKLGNASVTFFTSDEKGDYTIIVEGITPDGKSGISRLPFTVK